MINLITMKRISLLILSLFISYSIFAQFGCTDPQANNYDASATQNDGSCTYDITEYNPLLQTELADELEEISGSIVYDNRFFGLADSGNPHSIYEFDTLTGAIIDTKKLKGTDNIDWESMAIDEQFVYVGDTGNNKHGNRTDLVIYKFPVTYLDQTGSIPSSQIEALHYHYEDQTDFTELPKNSTRFDCEAIISKGDSLYLFMKDWVLFQTRYYAIPKVSTGDFAAKAHGSLAVEGLVTDATTIGDSLVVLLGSKLTGKHFLELLFDYPEQEVLAGNKRQILLYHESLGQPESIALRQNLTGYIGTEFSTLGSINKPQAIFSFDVNSWLFNSPDALAELLTKTQQIPAFPNPIDQNTAKISVQLPSEMGTPDFQVYWLTATGLVIHQHTVQPLGQSLEIPIPKQLNSGTYYLIIHSGKQRFLSTIVIN